MFTKKIIYMILIAQSRACSDSSSSDSSSSDSFDINVPRVPEIYNGPGLYDNNNKKSITITNECSFDISMGFTGGFAGLAVDDVCKKYQINDGTGRCFWSLDLKDHLSPGETSMVEIEEQDESEVVWSGNMYGIKSPYMKDICPEGKCKAFQGPTGTVTLAEFTMLKEGITYFDVSNIHGVSTPTSMGPTDKSGARENDLYREGTPGDCSWNFIPPIDYRTYLIEVKNPTSSCSTDDQCQQDQVCGSYFENGSPLYNVCGTFFGYMNAHTNCIAGSVGYPFFCENYHSLYACSGMYSQSGYSNIDNGPGVCGCIDYEDIEVRPSFPCKNTNPLWEDKAYRWIQYIKKACPSAYTYQYDDSTSTFTSTSDEFEIIFCPGDSEDNFFI